MSTATQRQVHQTVTSDAPLTLTCYKQTVPDRCRPGSRTTQQVKTVQNVYGLACILGLTNHNNQVSVTIQERSAFLC